jgi:hypothetical protein
MSTATRPDRVWSALVLRGCCEARAARRRRPWSSVAGPRP